MSDSVDKAFKFSPHYCLRLAMNACDTYSTVVGGPFTIISTADEDES